MQTWYFVQEYSCAFFFSFSKIVSWQYVKLGQDVFFLVYCPFIIMLFQKLQSALLTTLPNKALNNHQISVSWPLGVQYHSRGHIALYSVSEANAQTSCSLHCAAAARGVAPQIWSYDLHEICYLLIGAKFRPRRLINQAQATHICEWSPVVASAFRLFK